MTLEEYREKINPCYGCGCYDEDLGCTMDGIGRAYACPILEAPDLEEMGVEDD